MADMLRKLSPRRLKKRAARAYNRVGGSDVLKRREIATAFAKKHDLVYFYTVGADSDSAPVIRGMTAAQHQVDSNFCIGTHVGYDMAVIERKVDVAFVGFETTSHRLHVLEIDLSNARNLPFIFIGTRQLTKAFYAKVLVSRRDIRYLQLDAARTRASLFHGTYALIASPNTLPLLDRLFADDVLTAMAAHKYPFSVEIEGDSLIVFTEADKPSEQLMNKLLHYGLWLAKEIDARLV